MRSSQRDSIIVAYSFPHRLLGDEFDKDEFLRRKLSSYSKTALAKNLILLKKNPKLYIPTEE
jgi:hypothetical protein